MPRRFSSTWKLTLTQRIVGLVLIGLFVIGWGAIKYSESVLEEVLLDQVEQQAKVFLLGVEQEIRARDGLSSPEKLQTILTKNHTMMEEALISTIHRTYIYDRSGEILADTEGRIGARKDMESYHGEIFRLRHSYISKEIKMEMDDGVPMETADVIIPIRNKGNVVAALEAELNLTETRQQITLLNSQHQHDITLMFSTGGLFLFAFIWWVIHTSLIRPLNALLAVTKDISKGRLDVRTREASTYEIARLGRAVNTMADSIQNLIEEQEHAYLETMQSLAKALEAKDRYTAGHSGRVASYSVKLGQRLGLDDHELRLLKQGALMHDLGKIGIPDHILNKPGPLNDAEYELLREHPAMTATIMKPLRRFKEFTDIAAWHHERWDGRGYPAGLAGEDIPLLARIVAIADTWDAMTGDRIYRKGISAEKAITVLEEEQDSGQWDPHLIREFIGMIKDEQVTRQTVAKDIHKG